MTVLKKNEFVTVLAEKLNTTKKAAEETLNLFTETIEEIVFEQKMGVRLGDIGTLKVTVVPEREHKNPQNGEPVTKLEHYAVKFGVNAGFKRDLAQLEVE